MPSFTRTRAPRRDGRRRHSLPRIAPPTQQQHVGNQTQIRLHHTPTLPTRRVMEGRLSGGRWFGRSSEQSRIHKWLDRWHAGIATARPAIRLDFLERLRALVTSYRDAKVASNTNNNATRNRHITGLNTLIDELAAVTLVAHRDYTASDDLPTLTDLDPTQFGPNLGFFNPSGGTPLGHGYLNQTYTVRKDLMGSEGVFKAEKDVDDAYGMHRGTAAGIPEQQPNQTGRSVATYRIAQLMGVEQYVPRTFAASLGTVGGQVMDKVHGTAGMQMMEYSNFIGAHRPGKNAIYWLDLVCGQVDRHAGNFMLETDQNDQMTGGIFAIDNDLAFGKYYGIDPKKGTSRNTNRNNALDINGVEARDLSISAQLADRIIRLARSEALVRAALHGLLTTAEIDATIARLTNLSAYLIRRVSKRDRIT